MSVTEPSDPKYTKMKVMKSKVTDKSAEGQKGKCNVMDFSSEQLNQDRQPPNAVTHRQRVNNKKGSNHSPLLIAKIQLLA